MHKKKPKSVGGFDDEEENPNETPRANINSL